MDEATIIRYITDTFEDAQAQSLDGDTYVFIGEDRLMPFITLVTGDRHDQFSDLERPGVFALNIGIGREAYTALLGERLPEGAEGSHDFTTLDRVMPHPVYGRLYWVRVLNPGAETFQTVVAPLMAEAHALAAGKRAKRAPRG
jgi:hypothetical protein